jgi:hypothetical protein
VAREARSLIASSRVRGPFGDPRRVRTGSGLSGSRQGTRSEADTLLAVVDPTKISYRVPLETIRRGSHNIKELISKARQAVSVTELYPRVPTGFSLLLERLAV